MLVLTRKPQETICIGDEITISILRVKGRAVRVGIEAPGNIRVVRGELVRELPGDSEITLDDEDVGTQTETEEKVRPAPLRQLTTQRVNQILALRRSGQSPVASEPPILAAT